MAETSLPRRRDDKASRTIAVARPGRGASRKSATWIKSAGPDWPRTTPPEPRLNRNSTFDHYSARIEKVVAFMSSRLDQPLTLLSVVVFIAGWCVVGGQPGLNALSASYYPTYLRATGVGAGAAGHEVTPDST